MNKKSRICKNCRWWLGKKLFMIDKIANENLFCGCELLSTKEKQHFTTSNETCRGWQEKRP